MDKHVRAALGLLVVASVSLTGCSGGPATRSAAGPPSSASPVTSPSSTASPIGPSSGEGQGASTSPRPDTPPAQPTGDAAASAVAAAAGGEATFPSSCDQAGTTQVPVRLHAGKAVLPHGSELELDSSPLVTKDVQLEDGHTYLLVTLECLPPAGASHSQLFVYRADPGTTPRLLDEPITIADQVQITTTGEQDHEGLVVSAEGWSATAPSCCPDRSLTYFMTVTSDGVFTAPPAVQPLTR